MSLIQESRYTPDKVVEALYDEHVLLREIENRCSFGDLLPVDFMTKVAPEWIDYRPHIAKTFFQRASEYYGHTGDGHAAERNRVLRRTVAVLNPLTYRTAYALPSEAFSFRITGTMDAQRELRNLHQRESDILLKQVREAVPDLQSNIPHVYALARAYWWAFPGLEKVTLRSSKEEGQYMAELDLIRSYVNDKGLKKEVMNEAQSSDIEFEINPENPYGSIHGYIDFHLNRVFSRAVILSRFDDMEEVANLGYEASNIMLTQETDSWTGKAGKDRWKLIAGNAPQLTKEFLYISGAIPSFK